MKMIYFGLSVCGHPPVVSLRILPHKILIGYKSQEMVNTA